MTIETGVAVAGKASVAGAPLGGVALAAILSELFGPHTTLSVAIAAVMGITMWHLVERKRNASADRGSLWGFLLGLTSWCGTLYLSNLAFVVLDAMFSVGLKPWVVGPMAFVVGFLLLALLNRALKIVQTANFTWKGFTTVQTPKPPTGSPPVDPPKYSRSTRYPLEGPDDPA